MTKIVLGKCSAKSQCHLEKIKSEGKEGESSSFFAANPLTESFECQFLTLLLNKGLFGWHLIMLLLRDRPGAPSFVLKPFSSGKKAYL
uniref:Uncharacterized protein n=1 Tax=Corvus moneduloides TaxID=1196302 RepID=A0A8C3EUN9_CORMO